MTVAVKRAYEPAVPADGTRVLVDRLWPRGLRKSEFVLDHWLPGIAPSNDLRKWFHAQADAWAQFRKRYLKELSRPEVEADLQKLYSLAHGRKRLTLLFSSKNEEHNNATVLKDLLDGMRKPLASAGTGGARRPRTRQAATRSR
jgi:uncharacterized protein YeaO (DUF488 family)